MHGTYGIQTIISCCELDVKYSKLVKLCFAHMFILIHTYIFVNATYTCAYSIYVTRRKIVILKSLNHVEFI